MKQASKFVLNVQGHEVCARHRDESVMRDGECQECLDDKHEAELVARFR